MFLGFADFATAITPPIPDVQRVAFNLRDYLLTIGVGDQASLVRNAQSELKTMNADGSWPDQDYHDTNRDHWKADAHLGRLETISKAYYLPGTPLSGKASVKDQIIASLDYWLTADPQNANWWENEIGVPLQVGEILILLGPDAPPDLKRRGIELMKRSKWEKWTGQNLLWGTGNQIMRGCLSNSSDLVGQAYARMWQEVRYAGPGEEGIQLDHSFHQHGPLLYSGGYGNDFTIDAARFETFAKGTSFALPADQQAILDAYVLDGQRWMIRGGMWDWGVSGRELIRQGKTAHKLAEAVGELAELNTQRSAELRDFAATLQNPQPPRAAVTGNRYFWMSDYMSQQRASYFISTRMYSSRTRNTDGFINGENKKSHHLADGATYIAISGREYFNIYPAWDWLRIPGTTIEQNTPLTPKDVSYRGTTDFVGGVSDGMRGCCAMDLSSGKLTAHKAWFYFDDEFVCLGAGINCPTANSVYTSLNQCLLHGPVKTSAAADETPRGDRDLANARWVWHDSVGYIFPQPVTVHIRNDAQSGSWGELGPWSTKIVSEDVFSLWLDQGVNVHDGTYAYVVIPAADEKKTAAEADHPPVEIISNTPEVQAVWHKGLGLLEAAFWKPGEITAGGMKVGVDRPCLLIWQNDENRFRIAVSNPLNAAATVNVTVSRLLRGQGVTVLFNGSSRIALDLPDGLLGGSSVVRELRAN